MNEKRKVINYSAKLDKLYQQFMRQMTPLHEPVEKVRALFNWLWIEKPARYKPQGNYRLNEVIDAQLSDDAEAVGNCLGLTLLYNCLVRRMGIRAEAVYLENAFEIGPHVLTMLQIKESMIDIENIFLDGFDYKGHLNNPSRTRWGDQELVADIYHSFGNELFSKGQFIKALENYDRALYLNPQYEKAQLNKVILLDKMKKENRSQGLSPNEKLDAGPCDEKNTRL
jgi:tetratricopeptide (TPR) repeat protein